MTRIIAGAARGRRISVPPSGTRPTSDRVRESLFSSLDSLLIAEGRGWSGLRVLDVFAGSGALGLESLSRGAGEVVLVERARPAVQVLQRNIEAVGLPGVRVVAKDARNLPPEEFGGDLVFVDPPYDWSAAQISDVLTRLRSSGWIADDALVVVERPAKDGQRPMPWREDRRREYGDTALWYGRVGSEGDSA